MSLLNIKFKSSGRPNSGLSMAPQLHETMTLKIFCKDHNANKRFVYTLQTFNL